MNVVWHHDNGVEVDAGEVTWGRRPRGGDDFADRAQLQVVVHDLTE